MVAALGRERLVPALHLAYCMRQSRHIGIPSNGNISLQMKFVI